MNVENNVTQKKFRKMFLRVLCAVLWFFPLVILINMFIGGVLGGLFVQEHGAEGFQAGMQLSKDFFKENGQIVFVFELILWFFLSIFGILPGTSK